ncbi:MAG: ATP-binding protein [Calothrix sp. CSU_2_0]|nr:ATP-binding protein [Calothrix sp. CSU_2_0]
MAQISVFSIRDYVNECVHLLFWAYFKPYTFSRWLREIHPELKPQDNPFKFRKYFPNNPQLQRYAWQVWILTAVAPIPIILFAFHQVVQRDPNFLDISWVSIMSALLGWLIGLYLAFQGHQKRLSWFQQPIWFLVSIPFGGGIKQLPPFLTKLWLLAGGLVVALNMELGMGPGFHVGMSLVLALCVASRMNLGMMWLLVCLVASITDLRVAFIITFLAIPLLFSLVELLWIFTIYLLSRKGNKAKWLTYLPPRFNQRILISLPFISQIIVEAHHENPTAARETINYLLNCTNQQKLANQAIQKIAINKLQKCKTLEEIVEINNQLNWIPRPLPNPLGLVLPQLLDVSQDLKASMEATSPYSKYKSLDDPIFKLRQLCRNLEDGKNANLARIFGSIIQHWLSILETAKPNLKELALIKAEIRQVYIAGNALDPQKAKERFKGRDRIFRQVENLALADQPPVLLLYGRRRTGKTSALKYLPNRVAANLVPLLVDFQNAAIATTLSGLAEQLAKQIFEAAKKLPRRLDFPDPGAIFRVSTDPFIALENWFGEIERTFPKMRFLLCLDEFLRLDEFIQATGSKAPLNFLRSIIQHSQQWIVLFSASHLHHEFPDYWNDYLINTISIQLDYLQESEARELIERPVEDFPDNIYEPTAVDEIIRLTRCHPYLVQLVCYQIIELLNHYIRTENRLPKTTTATVDDVTKSIPKVLERGKSYFQELWKVLQPEEQDVLQRIIQNQHLAPLDNKVVRWLIKKEILEASSECSQDLLYQNVCFQVPLVQKYIEQEIEI